MGSVDARRDTPALVKKYLAQFHSDILGLTGSADQLAHFAEVMKTYFSKPPELDADYTVWHVFPHCVLEHSTYMYFLDKQGRFVDITKSEDDPKVVADKICEWLAQDEGR